MKKTDSNENGVRIIGDEYWIDYRVNGRRVRRKIGPQKKLAEGIMRKIRVEILEGRYLDRKKQEKMTFKEFSEIYAENYGKKKKSWETTDVCYLKKFNAFFGSKYLFEITPEMVERYRTERLLQKTNKGNLVSPVHLNRELACLKCMFNRAIDWGRVSDNPVRKVKFVKENNPRNRYLSDDELKNLINCSAEALKPVILFAVNTGMRLGEIQGIKWGDVNFERGFVTLRETKNGETRYVQMNRIVRETLLNLKMTAKDQNSYIFCNKAGFPYNPRVPFKKALTKANISDFRFHDLRHTAASYLAMAGIDLNTIRVILGHKSIRMVLRYAHLSDTHQALAVGALDKKMDIFRASEPENGSASEIKEAVSDYVLIR